jgi:hypothetical protein
MAFFLPLLTTAAGSALGGIAGHQKDVSNRQAYAKKLELYKNLLRGAAFTGKYPSESMLDNAPDSSGKWAGMIGGAKTGLTLGLAADKVLNGLQDSKEQVKDFSKKNNYGLTQFDEGKELENKIKELSDLYPWLKGEENGKNY